MCERRGRGDCVKRFVKIAKVKVILKRRSQKATASGGLVAGVVKLTCLEQVGCVQLSRVKKWFLQCVQLEKLKSRLCLVSHVDLSLACIGR